MSWFWPFIKKPISLWPLGVEHDQCIAESLEDHHKWLIENYVELNRQSRLGLLFSFAVLATIVTIHFNWHWFQDVYTFGILVLVLYNFKNIYKATR